MSRTWRPVSVDGGVGIGATWGYNLGDLRIDAAFENGVTSAMVYDPNDRLTNLTHAMGITPLHDVTYGYDAVGNRMFMQNGLFPNRSQQYKYDEHYRLTEFRRGTLNAGREIPDAGRLVDAVLAGQRNWTLDSRGNWTQSGRRLHDHETTESREANGANEITEIDPDYAGPQTPVVPTYDGNGNLTLDPLAPNLGAAAPDGQRYEYDPANRLSKVYRTNGPGAGDDELLLEIKYDALGRRVESLEHVDSGSGAALAEPVRVWHIVQGPMPIEEYAVTDDGAPGVVTTLLREFVWGAAFPEPVALIDHTAAGDVAAGLPEVLHYLRDALGSVVALANAAGDVVERYEYDPYGETTVLDGEGVALANRPSRPDGTAFYHDHDFDLDIDLADRDHLLACVNGNGQSPECVFHHDRNRDRKVDFIDLGIFQAFTGYLDSGTPAPAMFGRPTGAAFDSDGDAHLDVFDFLGLQTCMGDSSAFCLALYDGDGDSSITTNDLTLFVAQADGPGVSAAKSKLVASRYGNPFMWTAQRFDVVTGLYHFAFRAYSVSLGKFLQRDPIGYSGGGINLYAYVGSRPLGFVDPFGLRAMTPCEESVGAALEELAGKATEEGGTEFAAALEQVIADWKAVIDSVKDGQEDPGNLRTVNEALSRWFHPEDAKTYLEDYDIGNWKDKNKCNKFVGDCLTFARIDAHLMGGGIFGRYPTAGEWANENRAELSHFSATALIERGEYSINAPGGWFPIFGGGSAFIRSEHGFDQSGLNEHFGNIYAHGLPDAQRDLAHVGIYLGSGLYISATSKSVYDQQAVVIKSVVPTGRNVYRDLP